MTDIPKKTYLGDSVYAEIQHGCILLTTENGNPDDPSNKIWLEPEVISSFLKFVEKMKEANASREEARNSG
jgi:hypothetical protein